MKLPETFYHRIRLTFREEGLKWLENIDTIIDQCTKRWNLSNIRPVQNLSYNLVCHTTMPGGTEAILKVSVPNEEFLPEVEVIKQYHHPQMRRLIDYDPHLYTMLLEKIESDDDLRCVSDFKTRIKTAAELIFSLPVPVSPDSPFHNLFPQYTTWTTIAYQEARQQRAVPDDFKSLISQAETYINRLTSPNYPPMLLHGDLHHMNILKSNDTFQVIDPKGVIGALPFNGSRFIENELELFKRPEPQMKNNLAYIINTFAQTSGFEPEIIFQALYVDQILSTCWHYSDNEITDELLSAVEQCKFIEVYRIENDY